VDWFLILSDRLSGLISSLGSHFHSFFFWEPKGETRWSDEQDQEDNVGRELHFWVLCPSINSREGNKTDINKTQIQSKLLNVQLISFLS
jgi:hypothetical protein